ncbi:MAG: cobalamin-dependent protein [Spirochaetaceae bacterium]|nr:cobalamin-dependent protein [Spirochaetaceae bacterium]
MIELDVLRETVGRLDEEKIQKLLEEFISSNPGDRETWEVVEAFHQGMEIVGNRFEIGKYCAGDLIFAGELLDTSIDKLRLFMGVRKDRSRGLVVLGTVEGDVHDIGKKLFKGLIELSGFRVEDIGVDQKPDAFVLAVRKFRPQVLGLSGVLTLSIASMKRTVDAIQEAGLREGLKITIGGSVVTEEICRYVGADAWSKNAAESVKIFDTWF